MAKCEWTGIDCPIAASFGCWIRVRAERLEKERSLLPEGEQSNVLEGKFARLSRYQCSLEKLLGEGIDARKRAPEEIKRLHSLDFQFSILSYRLRDGR